MGLVITNEAAYLNKVGLSHRKTGRALRQLQSGAPEVVLNPHITTHTSEMSLYRLTGQQPFHFITSEQTYSFKDFLGFIRSLNGRQFKAWLQVESNGVIEHEVAVSDRAVSIDGVLYPQDSVSAALDFIEQQAPPAIIARDYRFGINAETIIIGNVPDYGPGIKSRTVAAKVNATRQQGYFYYQLNGALSLDTFESIFNGLIKSKNLVDIDLFHPALFTAVNDAHFFLDQYLGSFGYQLKLTLSSVQLLDNFSRSMAL